MNNSNKPYYPSDELDIIINYCITENERIRLLEEKEQEQLRNIFHLFVDIACEIAKEASGDERPAPFVKEIAKTLYDITMLK